MRAYFLLFTLSLSVLAVAQNLQKITIHPGENLSAQDFNRLVYQYPAFVFGKMHFRNDDSAGGYINYNLFLGAFQFVNNEGDTLVVTDQENIKDVVIGSSKFLYQNKEFLQVTAELACCKLGERSYVKIADKRKKGAFNLTTIANIESDDAFRADYKSHSLMINEDIILIKGTIFYLSNRNGDFLPANRKNVLKLFPKQQSQIEAYLERNDINFQNETDINNLLRFLESLKP